MNKISSESSILFNNSRYIVVSPDGFGSKGDEAMLSGVLNILKNEKILVITPGLKLWKDELVFRTHLFENVSVPTEDMPSLFTSAKHLIIIGADTLDGTCGYDSARWPFDIVKAAVNAGGKATIFCSVRSEILDKIKELWTELPDSVNVILRDDISAKNYTELTGKQPLRCSDLAFFSKSIKSVRITDFIESISDSLKDREVINIGLSEEMFRSFNTDLSDESRINFARNISAASLSNLDPKKTVAMLISHDIRSWEGHFSDYEFVQHAYSYITSILGYTCILVPPQFSQAELVHLMSKSNLTICGRMHMSVTSYCAGVVPIVVAGTSKSCSMVDKVRGMCFERLGTDENLVLSLSDISAVRDKFLNNAKFKKILDAKNVQHKENEAKELVFLRKLLNVTLANPSMTAEQIAETSLIQAMTRSAKLAAIIDFQKGELSNKDLHIEQLLLSERELSYNLKLKTIDYQEQSADLYNKGYIIYTQTELVNAQTSHIDMLNGLVTHYSAQNDILQQVYASKTWRISHKISRIIRKICPPLTIRSKIVGGTLRLPGRMKQDIAAKKVAKSEANFHKNFFVHAAALIVPFCENPVVSIIIPVYNQFEYTYNCIKSVVEECSSIEYEIILADDNSSDETSKIASKITGLVIKRNNENLRFLLNCNDASKSAKGKYILFLNNDTIVHKNWLSSLLETAQADDSVGIVGSKLVYSDGRLQEAGGIIWSDGTAWNYGNGDDPDKSEYNYLKDIDYISGCSMMIRRDLWNEIGGFDEQFAPAYCEDSDLAFTVREKGYRVVYQPFSVITHFEGVSNGTDTNSGQKKYQVINVQKFTEKWKNILTKENLNHPYDIFNARDKSSSKPCILFIDHYLPTFDQDAGSRTVYEYLKLFVKMGYNVKFIPDNFNKAPRYTEALEQIGIEVLYGSEYANNWKTWIKDNSSRINFVFTNRPHISIKYIDFIRKNTKAKIVYYGHDLHSLREMREYELTKNIDLIESSKKWKSIEYSIMRLADLSYYPSKVEQDYIKKDAPELNVKVLTPYIFSDVVTPDYKLSNRKDIMFIGGFNHKPNVDAVVWFAEKVLPLVMKKLPDLVWDIMGSHPSKEVLELQSAQIKVHGFVTDEELANFYGSSRLAIVPLRYGAGIKGKVIEAMNYGIPILTTSVGAEGILNSEEFLAIEDGAEDFANRLIALYNDEEKLRDMSTASCDYIRKYYSPENAMKIIKEDFV